MARLGLLSDSHGRADTTRLAVARLLEAGVDRLIHLGDVGSEAVLDALVVADPAGDGRSQTLPAHVVFGNTDWHADELARYAEAIGIHVDHPVGTLEAAGKTVNYQHGHDHRAIRQAVQDEADYLCHGHTHVRADQRQGRTRVINPGALFRARVHTVAVLDTSADQVDFFDIAPA